MSRLAEIIASDPEYTTRTADDDPFPAQFTDYVLADGVSVAAIVKNLERLQFEKVVTGKTAREILAEREASR